MLHKLFARKNGVTIMSHDFGNEVPSMGQFDAVISRFAIHHVSHERKRTRYKEIFGLLAPNGVFCNLEHVASPCRTSCSILEIQLTWLREIGFILWAAGLKTNTSRYLEPDYGQEGMPYVPACGDLLMNRRLEKRQ